MLRGIWLCLPIDAVRKRTASCAGNLFTTITVGVGGFLNAFVLSILAITPIPVLASGFSLFTGVDFVESEVEDEYTKRNALLVFGCKYHFNRYAGLVLSAGVGDEASLRGTVIKGSALFQVGAPSSYDISPYLSAGVTSATLVRQKCRHVFTPIDNGIYGQTACNDDYFGSTGVTIGLGVDVKTGKMNSLRFGYSETQGNNGTNLRILSVGVSF